MKFSKYMILEHRCRNCGGCLEKCPEKAIRRTDRDVCQIDEELCSHCGLCVEICQLQAIKKSFSISTFLKSLGDTLEERGKGYAGNN